MNLDFNKELLLKVILLNFASYLIFGFVIMLFSAQGHGSYHPFAVFSGWAGLPWILSVVIEADLSNSGFQFIVIPLLQYLLFTILGFISSLRKSFILLFFAMIIAHISGVLYLIPKIEHGHLAIPIINDISLLVSAGLLIFYWYKFYRLIRLK